MFPLQNHLAIKTGPRGLSLLPQRRGWQKRPRKKKSQCSALNFKLNAPGWVLWKQTLRQSLACEEFISDLHLWRRARGSRIRQGEKWNCHTGKRKPWLGQPPGSCGCQAPSVVCRKVRFLYSQAWRIEYFLRNYDEAWGQKVAHRAEAISIVIKCRY